MCLDPFRFFLTGAIGRLPKFLLVIDLAYLVIYPQASEFVSEQNERDDKRPCSDTLNIDVK